MENLRWNADKHAMMGCICRKLEERSVQSMFQDLRYALRQLINSPGFSLTAVLECCESRFKNYTQTMPSGGKDNPQTGIGVEIPRASFASRNRDERNHAPIRHETSDGRILEGSGWMVANPDITPALR
jgi:hypothetical protein